VFGPVKWNGGNAACPPSVFRHYTEINLKRGLEEIELQPVRNDSLYLVCSGPSLSETYMELDPPKGKIWALNAAFDWLCNKGIRPSYGVCIAGENQILNYFQKIQAGDELLFASQTHPDLVDRALERGAYVTLWHTQHPEEWQMPTPAGQRIFGGGTVGSRCFELAYVLGYRDVHVLGMDACLSADGRIAVDIPMYDDRRDDLKTWLINGRAFVALPSHARQVEDFAAIIKPLVGMEVTLYGDGMLQWAMKPTEKP
jgi:uncharacterized Rossmann fold enzyme